MFRFEFVVDGPPVSQQARRQKRIERWREEVRAVAARSWPMEEIPTTEPILVSITYFYDTTSMDVDNIPKPIIDALKELVYVDDNQVTDVICRKRNLNADLRVENPSSVLAEGFSRGNEFLYVVVEEAPDQRVIQ